MNEAPDEDWETRLDNGNVSFPSKEESPKSKNADIATPSLKSDVKEESANYKIQTFDDILRLPTDNHIKQKGKAEILGGRF